MYRISLIGLALVLILGAFQAPQDPAPFGQWMPTLARQSMRPLPPYKGYFTAEFLPLLSDKPFLPSNSHDDPETWLPPAMVQDARYQRGKLLFLRKCASCHNSMVYSKSTAPALAGATLRFSRKWLYAFTRDSQGMIADGDSLAVASFNNFSKLFMPSFPELTDAELDDIYHTIEVFELRSLVDMKQYELQGKIKMVRVQK